MRLAIPLFGSRVSPRFDHAPRLLLLSVEGHRVVAREEIFLFHLTPWQRIEKLRALGAQVVICGGIDQTCRHWLAASRIQVIPQVGGEAGQAVNDFLAGRLRTFPQKGNA
mgnify:CR=1 FL=1